MRDKFEKESHLVSTAKTEDLPRYDSSYYEERTILSTHIGLARGRADITQGDFVRATPYFAYEVRMRANEYHAISKEERYAKYITHDGVTRRRYQYRTKSRHGKLGFPLERRPMIGLTRYGWTPAVSAQTRNRCKNKVLTKLKRQEATLGATLGEITELRGMLINKLSTLIRCFLLVKRGKASEAASLMRLQKQKALGSPHVTFASAWLALELGWKPLMQEIFGLQEAIKNIADNRELTLRVTAVVEEPLRMGFFESINYSLSGDIREGYQIGIVAKMDPQFPGWLRRLGAGNPVSIAWELTTLSFVVDWFLNIGNFLNLLDATHSLTFVSGYETAYVKGTGTLTHHWTFLPMGDIEKYEYPSWDIDVFSMERGVGTEFPSAKLTLGDGLSNTWKRLTSLALVAARTDGKMKPMKNWAYTNRPIYRGRRLKN